MNDSKVSRAGFTTTVDLLRHGEPEGGRRFRGQIDDPLSELGWRQMWDAVDDAAPWQHIVSSPLLRCSAFAHALADKRRLSLSLEPGFKEIRFGAWEGCTPEEIQLQDGELYRRYRSNPEDFMPAGAETMAEFVERVAQAWESLLGAQRGRHVLLVCHAGVIRAVLGVVLAISPKNLFRVQIDYASVSRLKVVNDEQPFLVFHGGKLT